MSLKSGDMSEPHIDPSGSTQQFRAFAQRNDPEEAESERSFLVPGLIIGALVIIALVAFLVFS